MIFWCFMLISDLLIPLVMIGFGRLFSRRAPKHISRTFGYRTAMSMKNRDTWEFAHQCIGRLWLRCGLIALPCSVIPFLFVLPKDANTVGTMGLIVVPVQLILLLGTIFPTEAALKRTFDENGMRR